MVTRRLILVLLGCLFLALPSNATSQSSRQLIEASQIKCSITVDDSHWSKPKPAHVVTKLENIADKDVSFWAAYDFYLTNMASENSSPIGRVGDGYWSPAGMINKDGQLELIPNDLNKSILIKRTRRSTTSRFPNEEIHLRKGEVKLIKVDLTQFLWEDRLHSVWPNKHLFNLMPAGKYHLEFEINIKEKKVASNQIEVQIGVDEGRRFRPLLSRCREHLICFRREVMTYD